MNPKPLIAYCCFGESYAPLLQLSVQSLVEFGKYTGRVLVITDLSSRTLRLVCPFLESVDASIVRIRDNHPLASKVARYRLHRHIDLSGFAPVLYVDCDIIFDKPILPMLVTVAAAKAVCFPSEPDSVAMWSAMGGNLFRAGGMQVDGCGFNSGTMGIPDGSSFDHQFTCQIIASMVLDSWTHHRDLFEQWIDQPVVNFLHARYALFDVDRLTRFLRYNFQNDAVGASVSERTGAVHFFDFDKESRMRDYLNRLLATPTSGARGAFSTMVDAATSVQEASTA